MTKVGLAQINSRFSGQIYLPLSVGALQAYAQRHLQNSRQYQFCLPSIPGSRSRKGWRG